MKQYLVTNWYGRSVVLTRSDGADFAGTGMALAGVLKKNETLDQWKQRCNSYSKKIMKEISLIKVKRGRPLSRNKID